MSTAMAVRHFDLAAEQVDALASAGPVLTLFWWRDLPVGMIASAADELPFSTGTLDHFRARFAAQQRAARDPGLGAPHPAGSEGRLSHSLTRDGAAQAGDMAEWLRETAQPSNANARSLSVIVCTRDRGEALATCLQGLARQRHPAEVIVVDNSPDGNARELVGRFPDVRYVHEPQPGLSHARNAGLAACSLPLLAFTDDDVVPDAGWTSEVAAAFEDPRVEAMTGLVLPLRLDTPAQCAFQFAMGGFGSSFVPAVFDQRFFAETMAGGAHVWRVGAGANMAFRRSVFDRVGPFDARLGAGASGCSEDSEMWYRILATGGRILYEPRAVVYHEHRRDLPGLYAQMRAYMKGHVAALIVQGDRFGHRGNIRRIFTQLPRYFAVTWVRTILDDTPARRSILWREIAGWAAGLGYLASPRWRRSDTATAQSLAPVQRELRPAE